MLRFKNYNSTGTAPDGRLYSGDMNLFQDLVAALTDFTQTISLGTLKIGENALQLLRFGAGEARLTGHLRTDGILRGLGGLVAGAFTTAQRDAIAAGSRPYGLVIINTTLNRLEWNAGTDAVPNWQGIGFGLQADEIAAGEGGTVPTGTMLMTMAAAADAGYELMQGQEVSRSGIYLALFNKIGTVGGPGNGSTTFNIPDMRQYVPVGRHASQTEFDVLGETGGAKTHTLTGLESGIQGHGHPISDPGHAHGMDHDHQLQGRVGFDVNNTDRPGMSGAGSIFDYGGGGVGTPIKNFFGSTNGAGTGITVNSPGNSNAVNAHNNLQPYRVVNFQIKL